MTLESLTQGAFAQKLHAKFKVTAETGEAFELELAEVNGGTPVEGMERFSVIFSGSPQFMLPQRTYRVEHEQLGSFDLFLVPVAREADGFRYEAIFNRYLRKAESA